jgi:glycosyltransferase involved in cell wall biosynthesis
MMNPAVSIVICLYNSGHYIEETIASVLAQDWTDFEVVIVDDGSTDGSADRVDRLYRDRRLRVVRRPHRGMTFARSEGFSLAQGKYVAFLDHDDVWDPFKLRRQMEIAAARPDMGLIFSDSMLIDESGRAIARMSDRYDYNCIELDTGAAHHELLARGCFIPLSTALVRRDVIVDVGGLNCDFVYAADYDLWLRVSKVSALAYLAEPLSAWRIHAAQSSQRQVDLAAAELARIWKSVIRDHSYPAPLRALVADHLIGQQRLCLEFLLKHGRLREALHVALTVLRDPIRRHCVAARLRHGRIRHLKALAKWCGRLLAPARASSPAAFVRSIGDDRIRLKRLSELSVEWNTP